MPDDDHNAFTDNGEANLQGYLLFPDRDARDYIPASYPY
jgi:hypothetical protein